MELDHSISLQNLIIYYDLTCIQVQNILTNYATHKTLQTKLILANVTRESHRNEHDDLFTCTSALADKINPNRTLQPL